MLVKSRDLFFDQDEHIRCRRWHLHRLEMADLAVRREIATRNTDVALAVAAVFGGLAMVAPAVAMAIAAIIGK